MYGDFNWAASRITRKSTSAGAIKVQDHCINTWSMTQGLIARSSAEAELYGGVRAASEALGIQTPLAEFGEHYSARVHVDASAAKRIVERRASTK